MEAIKKDQYIRIEAENSTAVFWAQDLVQVLYEPLITRIPSHNPLLYGILYDGHEMIALVDISEGLFCQNRDFGKMCVILSRNGEKLAVAAAQIKTEELREEDMEFVDKDLFGRFHNLQKNE